MATLTILEPMSTGDVIDRSVRLYRRNFVPLILIVAVPSLVGYFSSVIFWLGYSEVLGNLENPSASVSVSGGAILAMLIGGICYPLWFFLFLYTWLGLSRVVSDHIMLGEAITFRKCFASARKRIGDAVVLGLLTMGLGMVFYLIFIVVIFLSAGVIGVVAGMTAYMQLPPWLIATVVVLFSLTVLAGGIFILLYFLARFVFLPQVMVVEGVKVGEAMGRAFKLGGRNWHRVGAIMLFIYFISLSLLGALLMPTALILYLLGYLEAEFFFSPIGNILQTSFNQIANTLVLPIWVVSFTLLYFDSRVRKEGYDLDLLAREVSPDFYWQPMAQQPFGYQVPNVTWQGRTYVQTSPLGLAGYRPPPPVTPPESAPAPPFVDSSGGRLVATPIELPSQNGQSLEPSLSADSESAMPADLLPSSVTAAKRIESNSVEVIQCPQCSLLLQSGAKFCVRCGKGL